MHPSKLPDFRLLMVAHYQFRAFPKVKIKKKLNQNNLRGGESENRNVDTS